LTCPRCKEMVSRLIDAAMPQPGSLAED